MKKHYGVIGAAVSAVLLLCCVAGVVGACLPEKREAVPDSCRLEGKGRASACEFFGEGRVTEVVDGATVKVNVDKRNVRVRILGIAAPSPGEGLFQAAECWGAESQEYASRLMSGATVSLFKDIALDQGSVHSDLLVHVLLADGSNYSIKAAGDGMARAYIDETGRNADQPTTLYDQIADAEARAKQSATGLWGAPCRGSLDQVDAPPTPTESPSPTESDPQDTAAPEQKTEEPAEAPETTEDDPGPPASDEPEKDVYYENCDAVRAAGAAPLYADDPGYSRKLDRDGDGVACE